MKIIELYGYSCSGKSYLANKIKDINNFDISYLSISKKQRLLRFFIKFFFIFSLKFTDYIFVLNIHRQFEFITINHKLKNFFSFLYLIGFVRKNVRANNPIIIDHGIFQCLFSCYIFAYKKKKNEKQMAKILINFFLNFPINFSYEIICVKPKIKIIKLRLRKTKKLYSLNFLEKNEKKIKNTYLYLQNLSNYVSAKLINIRFF